MLLFLKPQYSESSLCLTVYRDLLKSERRDNLGSCHVSKRMGVSSVARTTIFHFVNGFEAEGGPVES